MKKTSRRTALLAVLLLLTNNLTGLAASGEELPDAAVTAEAPQATITAEAPDTTVTAEPKDAPVTTESKDAPSLLKSINILHSNGAPSFHAYIEYSFQGYFVKGSLTEIPSDISLIQPLYSMDGTAYQICGEPWDLHLMNEKESGAQEKLHNQICLYSNQEPLKSYLDGKTNRFYLKLRLELKDKTAYETQAALIDRGSPQPVPEDLRPEATFAHTIAVSEMRPFRRYGSYQITVSSGASYEEISSCLPDTLPVEIQLSKENQMITNGVIDCPVTWKPLSLPPLTAGESITIHDAAEEIIVPEGSLLTTPTGIFRLDKPLKLSEEYGLSDEVRLVLNVVSEDKEPSGALKEENNGLEMAFHLKPTNATAIYAYVWSENNPVWTNLPDLPLTEAVNAQPSTPSSGYTLVISPDQEPYQSYLLEKAAGNNPSPFLIGLTIKGGIYDGKSLILPWPETYDIPPALPMLGGSGGNEANAGSDNKNDGTQEGQRPNLPQNPQENSGLDKLTENLLQNLGRILPATGQQAKTSRDFVSLIQKTSAEQPLTNPFAPEKTPAETDTDTKDRTTYAKTNADNGDRTTTGKTDTDSGNRTTTTETDTDNGNRTETAETDAKNYGQAETNETDSGETPSLQEMPDRSTADKNRHTFPPLAAAAVFVIGIGITAAISRIIADKNSGRILHILQKLHQKRRTFARR